MAGPASGPGFPPIPAMLAVEDTSARQHTCYRWLSATTAQWQLTRNAYTEGDKTRANADTQWQRTKGMIVQIRKGNRRDNTVHHSEGLSSMSLDADYHQLHQDTVGNEKLPYKFLLALRHGRTEHKSAIKLRKPCFQHFQKRSFVP